MADEIVVSSRNDAPSVYGTREEIRALASRMQVMLPNARLADWQKSGKYAAQAQESLDSALFRAAQICAYYRLVPGEDVHIIPFGNSFSVDIGVEAWKRAADRFCAARGITWHVFTEEMDEDELRQRRGDDYDPEDRGAVAYLWRSDKAQLYDMFGKESMTRGYGVWRKRARRNSKGRWEADPIQAHRTAQDVANRRALKMALKKEFSLDALLSATPAEEQASIDALRRRIAVEEMSTALPMQSGETYEENGMLMAGNAHSAPKQAPVTPEPSNGCKSPENRQNRAQAADERLPQTLDDVDELDFDDIPDAQAANAAAQAAVERVWVQLRGKKDRCAQMVHRLRQLESGRKCSAKQYGFLVGLVDGITQDGAHRAILHLFTGHPVDKERRLSASVASKLIGSLKEDGPDYWPAGVECVRQLWRMVQEEMGQGALL